VVVHRLLKYVGVFAVGALALIGLLSATRGTPVEYVMARGDPRGPPAPGELLFTRTLELYTGVTLHAGNRVQVLENGDGTYPLLWRDLRSCRQTVTVQMYFAKPGAVADTMAAILGDCARRGVRVLLLLDGFGAQTLQRQWAEGVRRSGVEVAWLRQMRWYALHEVFERSHARVVVVDGRVGYTGGFGLADYWLGAGRKPDEWRETNVRFEGPAVAQLQEAFATTWAEATGELLTGVAVYPDAPDPAAPLPRSIHRRATCRPSRGRRPRGACARGSSTPCRARGARRPSACTRCRSRARGSASTSRTPTSSPTTTSDGCSSPRRGGASTCACSPPDPRPT
jgi:cardiolipin synthase